MNFDFERILAYLSLPQDYHPSPSSEPLEFLAKHLCHLPPELLHAFFESHVSPKQRSALPIIRNRRLAFTNSRPPVFQLLVAKRQWPLLYPVRERYGIHAGMEEKAWAENDFLGGQAKLVGKLGSLLRDYEEERESERVRNLRSQQPRPDPLNAREDVEDGFQEEFDSDEEEMNTQNTPSSRHLFRDEAIDVNAESPQEIDSDFLRTVKERFIYGMLEGAPYSEVDWNDRWDAEEDEREMEGRWFDDE